MEEFRKTLKELPWIAKLLLVIFGNIYGILYRFSKGDTKSIVIAVIMFLTGSVFGILWLVDLITIITKKEVTFLAD